MKVVRPLPISLTTSSVPENDHPAWAADVAYALGARVILPGLHRVFESAVGGNQGNNPATAVTFWTEVGPTNRWAMFETAAGPATSAMAPIVVTLALPDAVDAIGLVDLQAASVRLEISAGGATILDQPRSAPAACEVFLGLPPGVGRSATITITPAPGAAAIIGKLITGTALDLGKLADAPTVGLTDFSRRETDEFGVTIVVERSWTKRIEAKCRVPAAAVDSIQRQLAAFRAQAVLWIGKADNAGLITYGFYKDFSQVISLQGISTCSLSIDGLPAADIATPAADPAVSGVSDFQVVRPAEITDAALVASSVPESDYPVYSSLTTYAAGARVVLPATHRAYESLTASNAGHNPVTDSTHWLDIGPTNRWAMFDQALGTATTATGAIEVQLKPDTFADAIAVLDATGASVRVQAPGYDRTQTIGGEQTTALFLDLALAAGDTATVTISAAGGGSVAVGTLLIGAREGLGKLEDAPTVSTTDFSIKNTDDFGQTVPIERAWAKKMEGRSLVATTRIDGLMRRLATLRGKPSLWIGAAELDTLTIYGFFRDFTVTLGERVSIASVTIEGLAKAASAVPFNAAIEWENITGPGKPADNATVGAPPGTSVGGVPASAVADAIKDTAGNVVPFRDQLAATKATIDAAVALARLEAAGAQDDATQARIDLAAEVARAKGAEGTLTVDLAAVKTTADGAAAGVTSEATVRAQQDLALSNRLDVTEAQLGGGQESGLRARIANEETARANADNAIANRVLTVESTYAAASGTLNPNPSFSIWPNGQQLPTSWNAWGDGLFDLQRQADTRMLNAWCLRQAAPANVSTGVFQALPALGSAGWYVLVADVELLSGTWRGAGITLSGALNLRFDNVADSDGVLSATQLGVRHFSLLVRKDGSAWTNFHAMTNWDGFGAGREAKNLIWRHCSVRVANDAEIKAGKAFTDAGTALARITTEETTRASQDLALADRLNVTEAQLSGGQDSGLRARIANEETARVNAVAAIASRTNTLEASVSVDAAAINANPTFKIWPDGQLPTGWGWWDASAGIARTSGVNGRPYAAQFAAPANQNAGIQQSINAAFGAFVIEFTGRATDWQGAGVLAQFCGPNGGDPVYENAVLNAAAIPDSSGYTSADGGGGAYTRTFSVFYKTGINGGIRRIQLYAMANWDGFGERHAKTITFDRVSIRPATAAEIAAQRADANATDALARIATEQITRADAVSALASEQASLQTTVNGHTSTLTQYGQSLDGLKLRWGVEFNSNGRVSGFQLLGSGGRTDAVFEVDNFFVGIDQPFAVIGGVTYIKKAKIRDADIDTLKIANQAVTIPVAISSGLTYPGNNSFQQIFEYTLNLPAAGQVFVLMSASHIYTAQAAQLWVCYIEIDGQQVSNRSGTLGFAEAFTVTATRALAAGAHTIRVFWKGAGSVINLSTPDLFITTSMR